MLARAHYCRFPQECEEEERKRGEEEIRRTEERRAKELYISLKHEEKRNDRDDKEWQEQCARTEGTGGKWLDGLL